jgi:hypothetical protein
MGVRQVIMAGAPVLGLSWLQYQHLLAALIFILMRDDVGENLNMLSPLCVLA